jgi:Glycosyltransferase family 28 C-terminal domain
MLNGATVLVAPLAWGLGHATRCIPIVHALLSAGARPLIGAYGDAAVLLRDTFPLLPHVVLPGPTVRYSIGSDQRWALGRQFPGLLWSVYEEHRHTRKLCAEHGVHAIISDQRFGVRAPGVPSVLITHQVFPTTPTCQAVLRRLNLAWIRRFDRCWVMDTPEAPGLAGALAHGGRTPSHAVFIGTHSRLTRVDAPQRYRVVAVVSGPEPHRHIFADLITAQLEQLPGEHLLVLGTPATTRTAKIGNVHVVPHLDHTEMAAALCGAEHIVVRSGYTTLMDLSALGRRALLVPTPGQPEQEYLAALHESLGNHLVQRQDALDLRAALRRSQLPARQLGLPGAMLLRRALEHLGGMITSRGRIL